MEFACYENELIPSACYLRIRNGCKLRLYREKRKFSIRRNSDVECQIVIPIQYEYAEVFDKGKAKVMLDGRTFFINPDGVEVPE